MATRKVDVGFQGSRPAQRHEELISIRSRIAGLEYDAGHLGASTLPGMAIPDASADFHVGLGGNVRFFQLTGFRVPFICRSIGVSIITGTNGRAKFGLYELSRDDLDRGTIRLVQRAKTSWVSPSTSWENKRLDLDRSVPVTPGSIWFAAAVRDADLGTITLPGVNDALGRPAGGAFQTQGEIGGMGADLDDLPGAAGPLIDQSLDVHVPTNVFDIWTQSPDDADRDIPMIHALSRTAERLSWNGY